MIRINWKTVSTLVTAAVLAGCYDSTPTAPAGAGVGAASVMLAPAERPRLSLNGDGDDNTSADFVVPPGGGVFFVGNNAVVFPARSICDPNSSSYGPGTWDDSCEPAKGPIKIHATARTAKAGAWVDFSPALRFVPSSNPARWVWIYMYNPNVVGASDISGFTIKYASTIGDLGVDESLSDPTLRTYVDQSGAQTLRRVKHFSGFTTSSGRSCDPAVDADCYPDNGAGGGTGHP